LQAAPRARDIEVKGFEGIEVDGFEGMVEGEEDAGRCRWLTTT
jgi:hypothetical protein